MVCQTLGVSQLFAAIVTLRFACDVLLEVLIKLVFSDEDLLHR